MNLKSLMALAVGLLLFSNTSPAQLAGANAEGFYKKLKFNTVKCFNEARAQLKTQTNAAEYLKDYLHEKALQSQVSSELDKVMADVEKTLKANPDDCALVSVTVDFCTNNAVTKYNVRPLRFMGTGDTAVQALAPQIFTSSKAALTNNLTEGFNLDPNLSHVICFGVDQGKVKATPVYLPALRFSLLAAIGDLQKAEGAPQRPAPPTNLRIISSP